MIPEFQAILLAGGEGDRLYPLNEQPDTMPKAMLPVANRPLLHYSLKYLIEQGPIAAACRDIILVVTKHSRPRISQFLEEIAEEFSVISFADMPSTGTAGDPSSSATAASSSSSSSPSVTATTGGGDVGNKGPNPATDGAGSGTAVSPTGTGDSMMRRRRPSLIVQTVDENVVDSAQALKACAHHITMDFIVMSADTVCDIPLLDIVQVHRQKNASLTMVLKQERPGMMNELQSNLYSSVSASSGVNGAADGSVGAATGGGKKGKKKGRGGGGGAGGNVDDSGEQVDKMKSTDYIAIDPKSHRVAFYTTGAQLVNEKLRLTRSFMRRWPNTVFSTSLFDSHIYVFSKWVMDLLNYDQVKKAKQLEEGDGGIVNESDDDSGRNDSNDIIVDDSDDENRHDTVDADDAKKKHSADDIDEEKYPLIVSHFTSIKHELVPYLVTRQRTKLDFELRDREFPKSAMVASEYGNQTLAHQMSTTYIAKDSPDLIKCFAFIAPYSVGEPRPVVQGPRLPPSAYYCKRLQTLTDFFEINRDITRGEVPLYAVEQRTTGTPITPIVSAGSGSGSPLLTPAPGPVGTSAGRARSLSNVSQKIIGPDGTETIEYQAHIGPQCLVGRGLQALGERVTLKKSVVGNHAKIGKNSKLNNSILMDHVTIGENCTITNSVICSNSHIASNTVLDGCKVGFNYEVDSGEYKNEILCRERGF